MFMQTNRSLNILFLAQFAIEPDKGGVQRVTSILAQEFQTLGHRVLYCSTKLQSSKEQVLSKQQHYLGRNNSRDLINLVNKNGVDVLINQAGVYEEITILLSDLKKAVPSIRILTVHHNCISCLNERYREIVLGNEGRASKVLNIIDNPVLWALLKYRNRIKYKALFEKAIEVSDQLVLLAKSFKSELKALGVDEISNVTAIYNPASFKPVSNLTKENSIVYVGRLRFTQKRVDRLMEVLLVLHKKLPSWRFEIVGDGAQMQWMLDFKNQNNLDRINFNGFTNPKQLLSKAKILLVTSDFEGFGMVIPEAQAYGVAPVVTPCFSAVHEVVGKDSGIVLQDSNPETMVKAVKDLIGNPDHLYEIARQAQRNVARFDSSAIAAKWLSLINKLLDEG